MHKMAHHSACNYCYIVTNKQRMNVLLNTTSLMRFHVLNLFNSRTNTVHCDAENCN